MKKIKINRRWSGTKRAIGPGTFSIPEDISVMEARCCELDDAGYIFTEEAKKDKPAPAAKGRARRKAESAENKQIGTAPENKS